MPIHDPHALAARFRALEIEPASFTHEMHVAVAWVLLQRKPFLEAASQCAETIRAMAVRAGAGEKFNETITVAFMALVAEHMARSKAKTWPAFIAENPELLDKKLLARWYDVERLNSPLARKSFLMPSARPAA
jgi:hypothetical protein